MPWCCVFGCSEGDGTIFMHRFPSKDSIKKKWVVKYYERLKEKFKMWIIMFANSYEPD